MARLPWQRLYTEARFDKKLESLTANQFRTWFRLFCYAGDQDVRGVIPDGNRSLLSIECAAGNTDLLDKTIDRLVGLEVIELSEGYIVFINYAQRQYDRASDMPGPSRERKRKSRDVTPCHTDVTPCHTLDREKKQKDLKTSLVVDNPTGAVQT